MRHTSRWCGRFIAIAVTTGVVVGAGWLTGGTAAGADPGDDGTAPKAAAADTLGSHDADLLGAAQAAGRAAVTLIVATDRGEAGRVAGRLRDLGGTVARRFDRPGYVLASVPTAKVLTASRLPGVAAVDLDEQIALPEPLPDPPAAGQSGAAREAAGRSRAVREVAGQSRPAGPGQAGPGPGTPAANPYLPTHETGAVDFVRRHPGYDGRGVTIGIMDTGVALDHPALQRTSTGERKIVDWVTATDPVLDGILAGDGTWRAMVTRGAGPRFTAFGGTWTAPAGDWLVSVFAENITTGDSAYQGDVNRDGDDTDTFGILYDPASHDIRVDTDQDRDFTGDEVLRPYRERADVGHFGVDDPATPISERVPFVVEFREDVDLTPLGGGNTGRKIDFVNIGIVDDAHGSHVAGISAGNDMFGNAGFDGVAPGAKLVSARACLWGTACSAAALTTGMVDLVVNHRVDIVNMSIGSLSALNGGSSARALLYNELINDHGVQIFVSAGNSGPGLNTIADPAVAADAVAVGATISAGTWLANYGRMVGGPPAMQTFSARGPREDGGLKPNVVAPGAAISTIPTWLPGAPIPDAGYPLPPGYAMFQGSSMAAPMLAGSAALLLSAAKANDLGVTPAALRRAIYSSARWLDGPAAHAQGNGLVQVPTAWNLLRRTVGTRDYTVDAPVCTPLSAGLPTPHRGTGGYNRCAAADGGHRVGQSRSYRIRVTRTGGPAAGVTHRLSWLGNDGTFRAAGSVVLPSGRAATISVTARPPAGVHSAILRIDDPATPTVDVEVLNTVVAGTDLRAPTYAFTGAGSVERSHSTSFFVTVPPGAGALQVSLSGIATGSHLRFIAIDPHGVPVESTASSQCYLNYSDPQACPPRERDYRNPIPGIWEFEVEARRTSPARHNPFRLTARAQGVTVAPAVVSLPAGPPGLSAPVSWSVRNSFGPVRITGTGGDLGSAATSRPVIAEGERHSFEVAVPPGAGRLEVAIARPADPSADLDLVVLRDGTPVAQSADADSDEAVTVADPQAGTYTVQVVGFRVPAGTTGYDYRDTWYAPALGAVTVSPAVVALASRASGTVAGTVAVGQLAAAGRQLVGEITVRTDLGAVLGRGMVRIDADG